MKTRWALPLMLSLAVGACSRSESGGDTGGGGSSSEAGQTGTNGGHGGGAAGTTGTGTAGTTGAAGTTGGGGGGGVGTTGTAGTSGAAGTTGGAGKGGSGGSAGAGGSSGTTAICNFASGLNVAWVNFAGDVPNPDLNTFNTIFTNTYAAGGRVVRWWFHTNGTVTPGYDSNGMALPLAASHTAGVKAILNAAHTAGIAVNISLWSFDMLQADTPQGGTEGITATTLANNISFLQVDANRQAYIDNYLTPLVTALKGTPGLYSYEIFNEPEGMAPSGWATNKTTVAYIQKTVNWLAAAIHAADPTALVTNGAQTFDYCSNVSGKTNYYSDSALRNAGGKQGGTLDFYEVHYYTSNGTSDSCFTHPASYWGLDKKLVMGEFAAQATDGVAQNDLYTNIYTSGYNGAWAWSYDADFPWPDMQTAMQNVYNAHSSDVNSCP
jgi:hypothetical protein